LARLPEPTEQVVRTIIENYRNTSGLSWIHGQGSVFSRFTDDSDLDFIVGWDTELPDRPSLPAELGSRITTHGSVVLEQASVNGYDLDVMHLPRAWFEDWLGQLDAGQGWQGTEWPLPIYAASGLAHGAILLDPTGVAERAQDRLQHPPPRLVASVHDQLGTTLPPALAELQGCARRGDHWLHRNLTVQLLKIIYTGWFLAEGHLPPFPKRLSAWYERLGLDPAVIRLESACWQSSSLDATTSSVAAFGHRVLALLQLRTKVDHGVDNDTGDRPAR
jgi:hypothetical protein